MLIKLVEETKTIYKRLSLLKQSTNPKRIPVVDADGKPLMPTTPQRARRWIEKGKAVKRWSKLGVFYVQLLKEPSGRETQDISVGIDPGKLYTGMAVQSSKATLLMLHLVLPFKRVKERMEARYTQRRTRRGRRINRKVDFKERNHREVRFNNRKVKEIPPSIRATKEFELKIINLISDILPVTHYVYEIIEGGFGNKGQSSFSPFAVAQRIMIENLSKKGKVETIGGYKTRNIRDRLGLEKSKDKAKQTPESHAVDGIALASHHFCGYRKFVTADTHGYEFTGSVEITGSEFKVIQRPPTCRRQLYKFTTYKGGKRKGKGGSVVRFGYRKADFVKASIGGDSNNTTYGYISGSSDRRVKIVDYNGKLLTNLSPKNVELLHRHNGLIISHPGMVKPKNTNSGEISEAESKNISLAWIEANRLLDEGIYVPKGEKAVNASKLAKVAKIGLPKAKRWMKAQGLMA